MWEHSLRPFRLLHVLHGAPTGLLLLVHGRESVSIVDSGNDDLGRGLNPVVPVGHPLEDRGSGGLDVSLRMPHSVEGHHSAGVAVEPVDPLNGARLSRQLADASARLNHRLEVVAPSVKAVVQRLAVRTQALALMACIK